ncbi:MAG: DNA replication/repair protein RecF [Bacteroidia bacterium]|jgi:DNA replication and repair protein RecF|nr:DNA replication/repair protein RecF [Bacteroidia bacterium]
MHLSRLSLLSFRNYEDAGLHLCPGINCFAGLNGSGKTNLLDAIHYLTLCKSFLTPADSQNIRHSDPFFVIQGEFAMDDGTPENVYCAVKRAQKKVFKRNQKEYERLSDHIGLLPLVVVAPADAVLVTGHSEERRRFMDSVIAQYDRRYLDALIAYNRILAQRNALLKQAAGNPPDTGTLEILNLQLEQYGTPIHEARRAFTQNLLPLFHEYYAQLSGGAEEVELVYESKLNHTPFATLLEMAFQKDCAVEHTSAGIHKDDLDFSVAGFPLKRSGSQGQQKTFLIALKLAQYVFLKNASGKKPLLLLDDIHDKLDEERLERLAGIVTGDAFGQLFVTDTSRERMMNLFASRHLPFQLFSVEKGQIEQLELFKTSAS